MIHFKNTFALKLIVSITVLVILSCKQKQTAAPPVSFDFIDMTMVHGWITTSVHLDKNKNMIACSAWGGHKEKYYTEKLDLKSSKIIDSLLPIILKTQHDTSGGFPAPDGTSMELILSGNNKKITVALHSPDGNKPVVKLAYTLFNVVENLRMPVDTAFIFPSRDFLPKEIPK